MASLFGKRQHQVNTIATAMPMAKLLPNIIVNIIITPNGGIQYLNYLWSLFIYSLTFSLYYKQSWIYSFRFFYCIILFFKRFRIPSRGQVISGWRVFSSVSWCFSATSDHEHVWIVVRSSFFFDCFSAQGIEFGNWRQYYFPVFLFASWPLYKKWW